MFPHERSLVQRLANKPFVLLGVNSDDDREALKRVIQKEHITWRSWWDGPSAVGPITEQWGVEASPSTFVIDHRGYIRYRDVFGKDLDKAVDTLLQEMEQGK
jgi:peroxiredoxin